MQKASKSLHDGLASLGGVVSVCEALVLVFVEGCARGAWCVSRRWC
jgi:hypothetical protein